jgi:hypothetical protein
MVRNQQSTKVTALTNLIQELKETTIFHNLLNQPIYVSNKTILIMGEMPPPWIIITRKSNKGRMRTKDKNSCRRSNVRKMNYEGNIKAWKIRWVWVNISLQKSFFKKLHLKWIHKFHREVNCSICNWCHCLTYLTKEKQVNCPKLTVHAISFIVKQNVCWKQFSTESYKKMNEWISKNLLRNVSALASNLILITFGEYWANNNMSNADSIWSSMLKIHNQRGRTLIMAVDRKYHQDDQK